MPEPGERQLIVELVMKHAKQFDSIERQLGALSATTESTTEQLQQVRKRLHDLSDKLQPLATLQDDVRRFKELTDEMQRSAEQMRGAAAERDRLIRWLKLAVWAVGALAAALSGIPAQAYDAILTALRSR